MITTNFTFPQLEQIFDLSTSPDYLRSISLDNFYIKLQIWDTAGQQRFKGITKSYYTNADAVIVVYDVNDPRTFDEIKTLWINEVKNYCRN